jgi:hypothetical protein
MWKRSPIALLIPILKLGELMRWEKDAFPFLAAVRRARIHHEDQP